jgi:hypothetical protein
MKNIIIYIYALITLLSFTNCRKIDFGDPVEDPAFYFYLRERASEHRSFFEADSTYNTNSVTMTYTNGSNVVSKIEFKKNTQQQLLFVFPDWGSGDIYYLNYHNGDIDTLRKSVVGATKSNPGIADMDRLVWYYNDVEVKSYDFKNNPSLRNELTSKSCYPCWNTATPIDIFK